MVFRLGSGGSRRAARQAGPPAQVGTAAVGHAPFRVPAPSSTEPPRGSGALPEPEPEPEPEPGAGRPGARSERASSPVLAEVDRTFVQVFALVGEAIAGATHALLACDRDAAKALMAQDDVVDRQIAEITTLVQNRLVGGDTSEDERRELVAVLRVLPDLDRNGDLAEHIARRAARGLGSEMSARSRGLVERMGEVAATIWDSTADAFAERSVTAATVVDGLDDEMDDLHVSLTAELVAGTMSIPVVIELAMVARFYERFGDHAVNLARRMAGLVSAGPETGGSGTG